MGLGVLEAGVVMAVLTLLTLGLFLPGGLTEPVDAWLAALCLWTLVVLAGGSGGFLWSPPRASGEAGYGTERVRRGDFTQRLTAVGMRSLTCARLRSLIFGAFAQAVPDRMPAAPAGSTVG